MRRLRGSDAARALLILFIALGCESEAEPRTIVLADECGGQRDRVLCSGGSAITCVKERAEARHDCAARGLVCAEGLGCRTCAPATTICEGSRRFRCSGDGSALAPAEDCAAGTQCSPGACDDLCARADLERSYLGCEYRAVFTLNSQLDERFTPALSIGNGNLVPARVAISKGDFRLEVEVAPRSSHTVELAYDLALKNAQASSLLRDGSYLVRADVPITVHQFNPLYFSAQGNCSRDPDENSCYSHTNDASLLLPAGALRPVEGEREVAYLALSYPSLQGRTSKGEVALPSTLTVVALGDRPVRVSVVSSAFTRPSLAGAEGAIEALAPGATLERTLDPGTVLSLVAASPSLCSGPRTSGLKTFCQVGREYDLTGTLVRADGPVQVLSGHDCAQLPFDRVACDHLEEALPPLSAWGKSAVVTHPRVPDGSGSVLRVLSGADGNNIRFAPPLHEPVVLARGEVVELYAAQPLVISGDKPLLVGQFLVGQGDVGNIGGDPSLSFVVPVDQYRSRYNFSSPSTYSANYADVVARVSDLVRLDGVVVLGFAPIGDSGYKVATVPLTQPGAHELTGELHSGLGVQLYGTALYTSYMLPGGLDLRPLGPQGF